MIAIVSDSSISLTKKEAEELGVHIVPMSYTVAGRSFHENFTNTNGSYEKLITAYHCTTAQPVSASFMSTFNELLKRGYEVLCLVISSRLSGSYSSATIAAKEIDASKIRIVDTRSTAGGMKFLAERAQELINQKTGLEETALILEKERDNVAIAFSVENLEPLRRSGRLGFVRKSIGTILNIRPILLCNDGAIISCAFAKGARKQVEKLVEVIPENARKIIVHYLGDEEAAHVLDAAVKARFPEITTTISTVGPVLAIHLGIPGIGVAWML